MKKNTLIAIILILASFYELHAKMYTWTDEKGVTHISDRPPKEKPIQSPTPIKSTETNSTKEDFFSKAIKEQQNLLPKKVNTYITWIDIKLEGKSVINKYFVNTDELQVPLSLALAELKISGKSNILRNARRVPLFRSMVEYGYNFVYRYYDKENNLLHEFTIEQKDFT